MAAKYWMVLHHPLSRAVASQSVSESWYVKYSVTSSVKQTLLGMPFVYISLTAHHSA